MGEVVQFRDYQSEVARRRAQKALEEHLIHEAENIMQPLWGNDAGTIAIHHYHEEKDPA